ncbi:MAG: Nif3-like dinuclear metal center hexameric protein [Flavobacteriales bacterium]|nr:Nif3-like dinuclear metal center hexameric protein [Flavobacteriales bacterium]
MERSAPAMLQESYDNVGLLVGDPDGEVSGALVCLDVTEGVIEEAITHGCGLIIAHHPLIFKGLKRLVGSDPVQRMVIKAIRQDIAVMAVHTNLDNVAWGVNGELAQRIGLSPAHVLETRPDQLRKLVVFVPRDHVEPVRNALFQSGAGQLGRYDECSFGVDGTGTFRAGAGSEPFVGVIGERHDEAEVRLEVIYPTMIERSLLRAMMEAHPYEEVAHFIHPVLIGHPQIGSGLIGEFPEPVDPVAFLALLKDRLGIPWLRHGPMPNRPIRRVALCGGSGAFLLSKAKAEKVDAFVTGDLKYHDFFEADGRLLLVDVGHYGSEQFTMTLIQRLLGEKFPTFAVRLTETVTDPIHYS